MKRHQIVILLFAAGILALTFFSGMIFRSETEVVDDQDAGENYKEWETVKVFYSSTQEDPGSLYCDRTYSVERDVERLTEYEKMTLAEMSYLALKELLEGPNEEEKTKGFFTSINEGTKVREIFIEGGIATVSFSEALNEGVAGSCRVQAIRSQITETMKQFPEVKEVVISVDGRVEDILQP